MIDLVGIGNPKKQYPDAHTKNFESMSTYIRIAKQIISKQAPKYRSGLASEMLKSEDAVSNVVTSIMWADWIWTPNYKGKRGKSKTQRSLRSQYAQYAIMGYVKRQTRKGKSFSLESTPNNEYDDYSPDIYEDSKAKNPFKLAEINDLNDQLQHIMARAISCNTIKERDVNLIKLYYIDELPYSRIAAQHNMSVEGVRQCVKNGIKKLRKIAQIGLRDE